MTHWQPLSAASRGKFFRGSPSLTLTELHLHLEGSLSLGSAIEMAAMRNHPWGMLSVSQLRKSLRFESLNDFLSSVREMCTVIASPEGLQRTARELSLFLSAHRVLYAEVYCSPYIYVRWGMDYHDALGSMDRGFEEGQALGGANCRILLDTVRQWGPEAADVVLGKYLEKPISRVVGFGIGGAEIIDLAEFVPVLKRARNAGLRVTTHAGESGGVEDVWKAIDVLKVDRIAHGVRSVDDPLLLRTLAERRIPLDLAVTSNYRTASVRGKHPLRQLLDAGVVVTLNTDDPSLFRTDPEREWRRAVRFGGLSPQETLQIARNSIEVSFATEPVKAGLRSELASRVSAADFESLEAM